MRYAARDAIIFAVMGNPARFSAIRLQNVRTFEDVTLDVGGLTVLIGENGAGKSTIVEVCRILSSIATAGSGFSRIFHGLHGGPVALARDPSADLTFGVTIDGGDRLLYEISFARDGAITHEVLRFALGEGKRLTVLERTPDEVRLLGEPVAVEVQKGQPVIGAWGDNPPQPAILCCLQLLRGIETHLPFETLASWAARVSRRQSEARSSVLLQPAMDGLDLLGSNLANTYHSLKNDFGNEHWQSTLEFVRMGLGDDVESVDLVSDPAGGMVSIALRLRGSLAAQPASVLADGQLAFLGLVAIYRLPRPERSLLVFDEPDLHLHPHLVMRAVHFFQELSDACPVILTTHNDRLLDYLGDPANSIITLELDRQRRALVRRPDERALREWLTGYRPYRGYGEIRADGNEPSVLRDAGR